MARSCPSDQTPHHIAIVPDPLELLSLKQIDKGHRLMLCPLRSTASRALCSISTLSSHTTTNTCQIARHAHTYSRQSRGLYNGTHVQFGSSVSDSHLKTARTWRPNVHAHSLFSKSLRRTIKLRITANVWRTIQDKYDGQIDDFLTTSSKSIQRNLGARGENLRDEIVNLRKKRAKEQVLLNVEKKKSKTAKRSFKLQAKEDAEDEDEKQNVKLEEVTVEEKAKLEGLATGM